jgi:uncharacterized protein YqeY
MPLLERLQTDMVAAMKAKDELRLSAIRMLKAVLMKHKVDTMKEVDEAEEMKILNQREADGRGDEGCSSEAGGKAGGRQGAQ